MKHRQHHLPGEIFLKLAVVTALLVAYCSGCEVVKAKKSNSADSTAVSKSTMAMENKTHAGSTRMEDNRSKEENEWTRLTLKYLADKDDGDTTINNFIQQPATVIYESGKSIRKEENKITDSSWGYQAMTMFALRIDSLSSKVDSYEKGKRSETKGFGELTLVLICVGVIAVYRILSAKRGVVPNGREE
jgi:hypothetical protein